jgi:aminomethyltransferase
MPNLRTPLYQWHVDHKARMVAFGGWDMPVQYSGITPEHRAVRTSAGLFDISHMARFGIAGSDALALLEQVFTNSVSTMNQGQVRYGLVCNEAGGILDDILVYRWADRFTAVINASNREKILAWLEQHRGKRDVQISDRTFDRAMVAIQGPRSVEMVAGLFADDLSSLKYYHAAITRYQDRPCIVSRTGYTGEDGYEAIIDSEQAVELWESLVASGAVPCGLGARDTLRLEAAMPLYGHELAENIDPIQAGLAWAVKPDKGEFIGRAALRHALAHAASATTRIGLEVQGSRAAREGSPILSPGGTVIGAVSSGSFCPWLEKSLAMGYVDHAHGAAGTRLAIDVRGTPLGAIVVPLPFYSRKRR